MIFNLDPDGLNSPGSKFDAVDLETLFSRKHAGRGLYAVLAVRSRPANVIQFMARGLRRGGAAAGEQEPEAGIKQCKEDAWLAIHASHKEVPGTAAVSIQALIFLHGVSLVP